VFGFIEEKGECDADWVYKKSLVSCDQSRGYACVGALDVLYWVRGCGLYQSQPDRLKYRADMLIAMQFFMPNPHLPKLLP
jgi:hypothetical protein